MPPWLTEGIKIISTLGASLLPLAGSKYLGFNPKIVEDIWVFTILAMAAVGLTVYAASHPRWSPRVWPGAVAAVICLACLLGILALRGSIFAAGPVEAAFLARVFLAGFFTGLAGAIGFAMARLLN